jgi:hypothetical protein
MKHFEYYLFKKKKIRLTFIGIKTGCAPKLSAGPLEKKFGSPTAPGEKMLSFVPIS